MVHWYRRLPWLSSARIWTDTTALNLSGTTMMSGGYEPGLKVWATTSCCPWTRPCRSSWKAPSRPAVRKTPGSSMPTRLLTCSPSRTEDSIDNLFWGEFVFPGSLWFRFNLQESVIIRILEKNPFYLALGKVLKRQVFYHETKRFGLINAFVSFGSRRFRSILVRKPTVAYCFMQETGRQDEPNKRFAGILSGMRGP